MLIRFSVKRKIYIFFFFNVILVSSFVIERDREIFGIVVVLCSIHLLDFGNCDVHLHLFVGVL